MLERKPSCLTLQVQRANGEELTLQDLPHRPEGLSPRCSGAGRVPGRLAGSIASLFAWLKASGRTVLI